MLNIRATMTNNLGPKVEARDRFQINRNLLFRPFTSAKLIALHLFLIATTESALINELRKVLLH